MKLHQQRPQTANKVSESTRKQRFGHSGQSRAQRIPRAGSKGKQRFGYSGQRAAQRIPTAGSNGKQRSGYGGQRAAQRIPTMESKGKQRFGQSGQRAAHCTQLLSQTKNPIAKTVWGMKVLRSQNSKSDVFRFVLIGVSCWYNC